MLAQKPVPADAGHQAARGRAVVEEERVVPLGRQSMGDGETGKPSADDDNAHGRYAQPRSRAVARAKSASAPMKAGWQPTVRAREKWTSPAFSARSR